MANVVASGANGSGARRKDRLPVVKLGKYLRFDARDLRAYVDAKRAESTRVRARR